MAKGGRSKRWTRTQGSDRSTVTQNSKNGITWSYSNGSGNSRTTMSHRPDGRIVRTTTVRHGDGYTSRTHKQYLERRNAKNRTAAPFVGPGEIRLMVWSWSTPLSAVYYW